MFRTVAVGVVALIAVGTVLGLAFAVGALRIRLSDDGPAAAAPSAPPKVAASQSSPSGVVPPARPSAKADLPPAGTESIELPAQKATLSPGLTLQADVPPGQRKKKREWDYDPASDEHPVAPQAIIGWRSADGFAEWSATIPKANTYEVDAEYAGGAMGQDLSYVITIGDKQLEGTEPLAAHGHRLTYKMTTVGSAELPAGQIKIRFQLAAETRGAILRLRGIRLIPSS